MQQMNDSLATMPDGSSPKCIKQLLRGRGYTWELPEAWRRESRAGKGRAETGKREKEMKIKDQAMLVNLGIFGGMVVAYFQGYPILYIVGCGLLAFVVASATLVYRMRMAKRQRDSEPWTADSEEVKQ
jgi:hypothetical protein